MDVEGPAPMEIDDTEHPQEPPTPGVHSVLPTPHSHQSHRTSVEEIIDQDDPHYDPAPDPGSPMPQGDDGPYTEGFTDAAWTYGDGILPQVETRARQVANGLSPWAPFESYEEWRFGRWLLKSGISQKSMNELLELPVVSHSFKVST